MPQEAFEVHGLGDDFLKDQPVFSKIADDFLAFVGNDAKLVIHNAAFDMKFLNAELRWVNKAPLPADIAIDTLDIARRKFPGSPASEILAEVYLELIGGKQPDFGLSGPATKVAKETSDEAWRPKPRDIALAPRLSEKEKAAHAAFVENLGDDALWNKS